MTMAKRLELRKLADTSVGTREIRYDPSTGERKLVNPDTEGDDHEPWPLAGVVPVGDLPDECQVSTSYIANAVAEGWATLEDEDVVHRPGGPPNNLWAVTHTFVQASAVVFHFVDGDVRYKVTHQPDKYVAEGTDKTKVTDELYAAGNTRVDAFYGLKLDKKGR